MSVLYVRCEHCKATTNEPCKTPSGRVRKDEPHMIRWKHYRWAGLEGRVIVRIRADDPRFGLSEGEEYFSAPYPYDGNKITLLARRSDGWNPECNAYRNQIEVVGIAQPSEQTSTWG